jgi:aryl-alcohol dehydrogenase-like predicted oxidoreductase
MTSAAHHRPRRLGSAGPIVFPLALGCMGMSGMYGPADERESIATIHAALDQGNTLVDTGDYYGGDAHRRYIRSATCRLSTR